MRKVLIISGLVLVVLLSVPAAALWWICYTEPGLQWIAERAQGLKTTRIEFTGLSGYLAGPIHVERIVLDHPRVRIDARNIDATVHLRDLWVQTIHVNQLEADTISVEVRKQATPTKQREPRFLPTWLRIRTNRVEMARAHLLLQNGTAFDAAPVRASAVLTNDELRVASAFVDSEQYRITGLVALRARDPVALEGNFEWRVTFPGQPQYVGHVMFRGDLDDIAFEGAVHSPFIATYSGNALDLTREWNWKATVATEKFDLKPWQPESGLGEFAASINATGSRDALAAAAEVVPRKLDTGPLALNFRGAYAEKHLRTDELLIRMTKTQAELRAHGEFVIDGGVPTSRLEGTWAHVQWPLRNKPLIVSPAGTFSMNGEMPFQFVLKGSVEGEKIPPATFSANVVLDKGSILAPQLEAQVLKGSISGNGEFTWSPAESWRANLTARDLDPRVVHEAFPGKVGFRAVGSGSGFDPRGEWDITVENLRGQLRSRPVSGRARVHHEGRTYRVTNADIRFGGAHLVADGVYGPKRDLHVNFAASELDRVIPEARGSVTLRADLEGDDRTPHLEINARADAIEYRNFRVKRLVADGNIDLSDRQASWLTLEATDVGLEDRRLRTLRTRLEGRASKHELTVSMDAGNAQLELHTNAGYVKETWQGVIDRLAFAAGETKMALTVPAKFSASRNHAELEQACLVGGDQRACGKGRWTTNGPWNIDIQGTGLPLKTLAAGLPRPLEYSGTLAVDIHASGKPGELWTGNARADFDKGVFRYKRASGKVQDMVIGTGRAQFSADARNYGARINVRAEPRLRIRGEAEVRRLADTPWQKLPLEGSIEAETTDLGFVPVLLPEIDRASGDLKADLTLDGTLGAPTLDGQLELDKGEMDLFAINLLLREIGLHVDLSGNTLNLTASARVGEGKLSVTGDMSWTKRQPKGTMKLNGENLVLVDVPEARIVASPNLRFRIDGRRIDVDGAVHVPKARLAPANLTGAVLPSEDEVIVGEEVESPENRFYVTTGVHLVLGDDVNVASYGLTGKIKGGVLIYSATGEVSTGIGEIKIEEGKYTLYGRELDIDFGRLVFSGGPLSDPGVDLRAVKKYPEVLAGVVVRGTLRSPRLSFFSDPPLPQTQIVSIVVAGRTLDSIQDEGAAGSGGTSSAALLAQGGALLAGKLGDQLGVNLDEISVESESADETSLVLGKYLSPRLYVSYGISLTESINTIKLRYTISDHWTIKTEAGEARGADIVYTIDR